MIRLGGRPLKRQVYGGNTVGDLVVELRGDSVTLRPKGKKSSAAVTLTWNRVYYVACEVKANATIAERKEARTARRAVGQ